MGVFDRHSVLALNATGWACALGLGFIVQGCGLVFDAIQYVQPVATNELDAICARKRLQVGMGFEPRRPFVFPAIFTDEGLRVTGLDVELVREISAALTARCGGEPVVPVLHLVPYRALFVLLHEGKLDLFVSATTANVPSPTRAGLAYSVPYFINGGLGMITRRNEVAERVREILQRDPRAVYEPAKIRTALAGLTVAVQEGTTAHLYAEANLAGVRLVLCDSLPAAFESQDPPIDVIVGKQPILRFTVSRVRKEWRLLESEDGKPIILTREDYAVVMAEESYRLRWFINDLLFRLDAGGRLADMRRRWLDESYAFPRRAVAEGLPFEAENMPRHYDQGRCRRASGG